MTNPWQPTWTGEGCLQPYRVTVPTEDGELLGSLTQLADVRDARDAHVYGIYPRADARFRRIEAAAREHPGHALVLFDAELVCCGTCAEDVDMEVRYFHVLRQINRIRHEYTAIMPGGLIQQLLPMRAGAVVFRGRRVEVDAEGLVAQVEGEPLTDDPRMLVLEAWTAAETADNAEGTAGDRSVGVWVPVGDGEDVPGRGDW